MSNLSEISLEAGWAALPSVTGTNGLAVSWNTLVAAVKILKYIFFNLTFTVFNGAKITPAKLPFTPFTSKVLFSACEPVSDCCLIIKTDLKLKFKTVQKLSDFLFDWTLYIHRSKCTSGCHFFTTVYGFTGFKCNQFYHKLLKSNVLKSSIDFHPKINSIKVWSNWDISILQV